MKTAKALGFKKGDFVSNGFPGIIIGNAHTATPLLEVWGVEHECGSAYAQDLQKLTFEQFVAEANGFGYNGEAYTDETRKAIATASTFKKSKGETNAITTN